MSTRFARRATLATSMFNEKEILSIYLGRGIGQVPGQGWS